jgi:hypothetical protein
MSPRFTCLGIASAFLVMPTVVNATPFSFTDVAASAAPVQQLLMLGMVVATLAAIVVSVFKLLPGRLSGGSTFVSSLRFAGPVAGLLGAAYAGWKMCIGIATVPVTPTLKVLAPGFAEIATLIALGAVSGIVAIVLTWAIEARIDRQVLAE